METFRVNITSLLTGKKQIGIGYLQNDIWRVKTYFNEVVEVLNLDEEITVFNKCNLTEVNW